MFLFFMSFILKLVMVVLCVLLPFPSCLHTDRLSCSLCHVLIVCSCHVNHSVYYKVAKSLSCSSSCINIVTCCRWSLGLFHVESVQVKSSLFKSSQVCLSQIKSVWMFGYHFVNKLHLGSSLCSPSVDSLQNTRPSS